MEKGITLNLSRGRRKRVKTKRNMKKARKKSGGKKKRVQRVSNYLRAETTQDKASIRKGKNKP